MNPKRYFAAIFSAAILSISFLACDPKEDDPTTNPTPSTDIVKEIHGYYGKPAAQVIPIMDAKGWTKSMETSGELTGYSYLSSDSTKGLPTNPVPPVTKIFIIDCFQRAFEFVLKAI